MIKESQINRIIKNGIHIDTLILQKYLLYIDLFCDVKIKTHPEKILYLNKIRKWVRNPKLIKISGTCE